MRIPPFKDYELTKFFIDWDKEISDNKLDALSRSQANHSLLLLSPNKIVWEVKVSDTGVLSTTRVAG
jgi:hypothetical protein